MKRKRRWPITPIRPRQFIEAWQASSSVREVASKLKMRTAQVRVRACRYRQQGVPLKEMEPGELPVANWEGLAQYAAELAAPSGNGPTPVDDWGWSLPGGRGR